MDTPLSQQRVYQQLDWQWTFHGLTFKHMYLAIVPGPAYLGVICLFSDDFAVVPAALMSLVSLVVMGVLQYDRDVDYLKRVAESCTLPAYLSPFRAERQAKPFPISRQVLECPPR